MLRIPTLLCASAICLATFVSSCENETSPIGPSLSRDEVTITLDSTEYNLQSVMVENFDYDSRSSVSMLGSLSVPEYGDLYCSFVSRLMCATSLPVPDSIPSERVDSVKLQILLSNTSLTGDSLAPQQLSVYRLTKALPSDIDNNFNPEGYYSRNSRLGVKNYTLSNISLPDSARYSTQTIAIDVKMPTELGREAFDLYRSRPEIFSWPQSFAEYFQGIYVEPTFGHGCVGNIGAYSMIAYYYHLADITEEIDSVKVTRQIHVKDSVTLYTSSPEVLSSNNISYRMADALKARIQNGEDIITTPGGYLSRITFPAKEIVKKYVESESNMSVISSLSMTLPAEEVKNDYGIGVVGNLLMVKTSELATFFTGNRIPDNKSSFYAVYNSTTGEYQFSNMRQYIVDLVAKGEVTDEDMDFTLVPVLIETEDVKNEYTGAVTTYVTDCLRYIGRPTMTLLHTDKALVIFTYSSQVIN